MHSDLIAKLGALDGPSREVDLALTTKFFGVREADLHRAHGLHCYDFTSSLDAAVALVERVLPGVPIAVIDGWVDGKPAAFVAHQGASSIDLMKVSQGTSDTRPIALLIATLKTLEARDG